MTFDVVDRPLSEVIPLIQAQTRVNLDLTKEAGEFPVTAKLRAIPWREALDIVARRAGVVAEEESPHLIRIEGVPRVSFDFENADVRVVIRAIADISGANIVVGREVEGTVTVKLHDVPWRYALDSCVEPIGYKVFKDDHGILYVADPATRSASQTAPGSTEAK